MTKTIVAAVSLSALLSMPSLAKGTSACKEDIQKFCKDVAPGKGAIAKCLSEHQADLSDACKAQAKKMKKAAEKISAACKSDVQKLCPDVMPGDGRVAACLKTHETEVSSHCKETLHTAKKHLQEKAHDQMNEPPAEKPTTPTSPSAPSTPPAEPPK
jgi:hypothetical protein